MDEREFGCLAIISIVVVCLICWVIHFSLVTLHTEDAVFTIKDKAVVVSRSNHNRMMIYTDVTTYVIDDSLLDGIFNSSDIYGKVEKGKKYNVKVRGRRIPFLSMYQNIIKIDEVKE